LTLHLLLLAVKPLYIIAVKSCSFACKFIFAPFIFVIFKFHKHYSNFSSLPSALKVVSNMHNMHVNQTFNAAAGKVMGQLEVYIANAVY